MSCPVDIDLSTPEYFREVVARARRIRVPLSGYFDLTHRCNFRCTHCYAGHLVTQARSQAGELETEEVLEILSAAVESGCLFVVFSGGEPLLREDFFEVYATARRLGLIVMVFTNASLIDERHVALFQEYPPHKVEVSIYGATEETYRRVTRVNGAFGRVRTGIEHLLENGIRVSLKSMILRDNADDIPAIERMATEYGVEYTVDPLVVPRLDGDQAPARQRVEADRAVEIEESTNGRRADFHKVVDFEKSDLEMMANTSERLYQCGAGVLSFHVDPHGFMRPCLFSRATHYSVRDSGFWKAWKSTVAAVDDAIWTGTGGCKVCPDRLLCGQCVAILELEQASFECPPRHICELGKRRRRAVDEMKAEAEHAARG